MGVSTFPDTAATQAVDVAIVGAGISGLYCAWRLLQQDSSRKIAIVERLNRTGGRLDTDIIEVTKGRFVREEEGGMRFNYDMAELMNLNKALGLCDEIVPFPMKSEGDTNRFNLRGRAFTAAQATASGDAVWGEIYNLRDDELSMSPTALTLKAFETVLAENDDTNYPGRTPDQWTHLRETYTWRGIPLNQWQMWGLLRNMNYSEECITMLTETIGFAGPFKAPINAGDAFQILADFPKDPEYFTFKAGFSELPNALVEQLNERHPGQVEILLSTNVDTIALTDGTYQLTITEAPDRQNSNPFIPGAIPKTITSPAVILAVATAGMERLFQTSPALNQRDDAEKLWDNIHAARGMKLMKINLYFDRPWWENGTIPDPVQFGPNFTNLPINAVYPFYSMDDGDTTPDAPAALTIYCDFDNTNFWAGLQNAGPMFDSPLQRSHNVLRPQVVFGASCNVVHEASIQLAALFGIDEVPEPVLTSYRLWNGTDDFEYAYHQWRLNVVDSAVREYLACPGDNLYFCNEAISDMQGWVNGALRSSNAALAAFGIEPMPPAPCRHAAAAPTDTNTGPRLGDLWGR